MSQTTPAASRMEAVSKPDQSFFKQGAWLTVTLVIGGVGMYGAQFAAMRMTGGEYSVYATLVLLVNLMAIPGLGLQTTFADQTALAHSEQERQRLRGTVRGVCRALFFLWLGMAVVVFVLRKPILSSLQVAEPLGLWVTVVIALASMWMPIFLGLLQGRQDFKWYGWIQIANGAGRFVAVAFAVLVLGGHAAEGMVGVFLGTVIALLVGAWHTRHEWTGPWERMRWRPWLKKIVPLTTGWGVGLYMQSADMLFVQKFFPKSETDFYAAAGTICRALIFFTLPLAVVLFPKIVAARSRAESQRVLWQALLATAGLACCGAVFLTILPWFPLWLVARDKFLSISYLVPWFIWAMVPLTLVNVLVNYLLARQCWRALPVLVLIVVVYSATLWFRHPTFLDVVRTLGVFNLILVGVSGYFAWQANREDPRG
jgi:O-antigen/teichoic acid export membrane protein